MKELEKQDDVFIYTAKINFNISEIDFQNTLSLLSKEEKNRIISKKLHKPRCQSLASTLLIKKAIKDTLGLTENSFQIKRTKMNRPYIETNEKINIDFNISHSNEWVVCAIALIGKIGIDIEEIVPIDINIAKEFLSNEEWKYLSIYQGEKVKLFYKFWTLKESLLKAVGIGINDLIREINFGVLDDKNNIFKKKINKDIWSFYHTIFKEKYALSLTVNQSIKSIRFNDCKNLLLK